jgi:hypothetical protein
MNFSTKASHISPLVFISFSIVETLFDRLGLDLYNQESSKKKKIIEACTHSLGMRDVRKLLLANSRN